MSTPLMLICICPFLGLCLTTAVAFFVEAYMVAKYRKVVQRADKDHNWKCGNSRCLCCVTNTHYSMAVAKRGRLERYDTWKIKALQ